jgi:hypothetical protein
LSATRLIIDALLQDSAVALIVGIRVYPATALQGAALPYITVSLINEDVDYILAGATSGRESRLEVACHAWSFTAVDALAEAIIAALVGIVNQTVGPEDIGPATILKQGTDVADFSEDRRVYRRLMDFRVRWST